MARWRERDPIQAFAKRLVDEDVLSQSDVEAMDANAIETVDEAQRFADQSAFPDLDSLYDDVYVFSDDVPAWWTVVHARRPSRTSRFSTRRQ